MSTLAELVALIAADLQDPGHATWSAEDHTHHIRRALAHYSTLNPRRATAVLDPAAGVREVDVSALGALDLTDLWYPYDPLVPAHPPHRAPFYLLDDATLYQDVHPAPTGAPADRLRLFYLAPHTITDLDGADATSLDAAGEALVILLATASAAMQRCQATIGRVTVTGWTPQQLLAWATARQAAADRA